MGVGRVSLCADCGQERPIKSRRPVVRCAACYQRAYNHGRGSVPVCSICGVAGPLETRSPARCNACYQRWIKSPEQVQARLAAAAGPAPTLCTTCHQRAAHPVYGTCYRCGNGWPALPPAKPSDAAPVFPGRLIGS